MIGALIGSGYGIPETEELKKASKRGKGNMKKAMYAFSGDPITYGHENIVERAASVFDKLIVGIGVNPDKKYTFSLDERLDMAKKVLRKFGNVEVVPFQGLLIDYAKENAVDVIVKGVRNAEDFYYEMLLHTIGESQWAGIDTYLLPAKGSLEHVSSSAVRAIQKEQGFIEGYVSSYVKQKLEERISGQYRVGITGEIASGKSYVVDRFLELGKKNNIEVHNLDLDRLGHQIHGELTQPYYVKVREKIVQRFGNSISLPDGFVARKELGKIVFNDGNALKELDKIMYEPMLLRVKREMLGKNGVILVNGALLAEAGWTYLCNNNVVLIGCNGESQKRRLNTRGLDDEQIKRRLESQYNFAKKKEIIQAKIEKDDNGQVIELDNSDNSDPGNIERAFVDVLNLMGVKK